MVANNFVKCPVCNGTGDSTTNKSIPCSKCDGMGKVHFTMTKPPLSEEVPATNTTNVAGIKPGEEPPVGIKNKYKTRNMMFTRNQPDICKLKTFKEYYNGSS
jgi:RecJ-like exonuclease